MKINDLVQLLRAGTAAKPSARIGRPALLEECILDRWRP
jgi:hypothetical protein